jgi:DNA polymerase-3 subunit epsilon
MDDFLAIDFETASRTQRASACAVGWARFQAGQLIDAGRQLINPQLPDEQWDWFLTRKHGIEPHDVHSAPTFAEAWGQIAPSMAAGPLIAHNASFDMSVLRAELARAEIALDPFKYACSWRLARAAWPEMLSVSLKVIAGKLGIALDHHEPRSDAIASGRVLTAAIDQIGVSTIAAALDRTDHRWGEVNSPFAWTPFGGRPKVRQAVTKAKQGVDQAEQGMDQAKQGVDRVRQGVGGQPRTQRTPRPALGERTVLRTPLRAANLRANTDTYDESHALFGRVVAFTGTLKSMKRRDAFQIVLDAGGQPADGINMNTNLLVCGEQDIRRLASGATMSYKLQRATDLRLKGRDIELVGELDFLQLL